MMRLLRQVRYRLRPDQTTTSSAVQLAALAALVLAGWDVARPLGLFALGAALAVVGLAVAPRDRAEGGG